MTVSDPDTYNQNSPLKEILRIRACIKRSIQLRRGTKPILCYLQLSTVLALKNMRHKNLSMNRNYEDLGTRRHMERAHSQGRGKEQRKMRN